MNSLRRRLLLILLTGMTLMLAIMVIFDHRATRQELDALFDAQLAESAHVLLGIAERNLTENIEHGIDTESPIIHEYEQTMVYQIWNRDTLLLRTNTAPATLMGASTFPGYSQITILKRRWRLLVLWDPSHEFMIQIAEPLRGREHLANQIVIHMLLPSVALAIPLIPLLVWFMVNTGLKPLRQLRRAVVELSADQLEPLPADTVPLEIRPLIIALNDLFRRLQDSIEAERRFTADAAHELRTPLAALRTQAQVALRCDDPHDREHALRQLQTGVDRATHLIEQLLTLARLDPEEAGTRHDLILIHALAAECLATAAIQAENKKIELVLNGNPGLRLTGHAGHLTILFRNLLDNAIRYSPPHSTVIFQYHASGQQTIVIQIRDNGPGIAEKEQARVLERFYRISGTGQRGTGLGLSIVQRIATHHRATMTMVNNPTPQQGLTVQLTFPAPAS